ncbi:hypothetical protein E2C01_049017 [Portunus trituberculatus]|uniref:Uncharacterized protein n=1 Tax=Portunus trituberculatus TaxID=210409 RepID=A0A5B7GCI8_PORTR|nr:hypothetical protein [Portunus trituberculatus]
MEDSKVEGSFTRMISEGRGKPKLVVNIEISKNGNLCEKTRHGYSTDICELAFTPCRTGSEKVGKSKSEQLQYMTSNGCGHTGSIQRMAPPHAEKRGSKKS